MHDEEIKRIILEVYFLFKKIIVLTTSIAISLLSINGIYAQASVLNNINSEAVNASYLEKKDLNTNIYDFNNHIYAVNINNIDNSINIDFKSKSETIINDLNIHNKNIEEKKVDDALSITNSDNIKIESNPTNNYKEVYTMMSTAYAGDTITYMGTTPVRDPDGISTIAVDPSIIPLGSKVYIPGYGLAIASDTGGLINGNRIDLFLNSEDECINWVFKQYHYTLLHILVNGKIKIKEYIIFINISLNNILF